MFKTFNIDYLDGTGADFFYPQKYGDAGHDVKTIAEPKVIGEQHPANPDLWSRIDYIEYSTGLFIAPRPLKLTPTTKMEFFTYMFPRSSVSKTNLVLANSIGVIDTGYRNEIIARFKYVFQPEDMVIESEKVYVKINQNRIYQNGDRIIQLIFSAHTQPEWFKTESLLPSDRGMGGFGSTGR